jgi:hypothetical protein
MFIENFTLATGRSRAMPFASIIDREVRCLQAGMNIFPGGIGSAAEQPDISSME